MLEFENIWAAVNGKFGEDYKELQEYNINEKLTRDGSTVNCWIISTEYQVNKYSSWLTA